MLNRAQQLFMEGPMRTVVRDTVLYATAKAIPGAVGLLSVIVFVRILGLEAFGQFSVMGATAMMWSTFASAWLTQGILRYYSGPEMPGAETRRDLQRGCLLSAAAAATAVAISLSFQAESSGVAAAAVTCLLSVVTVFQTAAVALCQAKLQPQRVVRLEMIRTASGFILSLSLALAVSASPLSLLAGTLMGYLLGTAAPAGPATPAAAKPEDLATLWRYGWPLSVWLGVQTAFPWLDRFIIGRELGLQETGIFASLSDVVTRSFSLTVFPLILAVHPRMTAHWNQGTTSEAYRLLRWAGLAAIGVSVPLVVFFHFISVPLIDWLFPTPPPAGTHPETLVVWLAISAVVWQLALLIHKPLELRRQTRRMASCLALALAIKVILNLAWIPTYGLHGAIGASLAAGILYCGACAATIRWSAAPRFSS